MYAATQTRWSRYTKVLALVLAVVSLTFLFQIATHGHKDARNDAACRVCQVAHMGVGPAVEAARMIAPLVPVGEVTATVVPPTIEFGLSKASPRAPPSSVA